LQSTTTLEAKKINVSEMVNTRAKVHNVAYNNKEEVESHQDEEDNDSSKREKADSEWHSEDEKEEDKNTMMKGEKVVDIIRYNIHTVQCECLLILP
jgi:hypothetical protein